MPDSLRPHGLQHARLPCPSPSPGACSLCRWCHPTISSSVILFSPCPQSFPASESFPISWLFTSGGQSIQASASAIVLPRNIQGWFPLGLTGLIFWMSKGLSRVFFMGSQRVGNDLTTKQFRSISSSALSFMVQHSHLYMTTGKTITLTRWTFVDQMMSLLFKMLSRFLITFLPRSKHLLI